jgi:hypothetical protein
LIGRLDRELVAAARVALLVVVQPVEAEIERRDPVEKLIVPLNGCGPLSPSPVRNSAWVTSPDPDGVKAPACGLPVPASEI